MIEPAGSAGVRVAEPILALLERHPSSSSVLVEPASGDILTYDDLREVVERVARQLVEAGVEPGDAVAFSLGNGPEPIVLLLAASVAGAAAAPLNPAYTEDEFISYLADIRPRVMVTRGEEAPGARTGASALGIVAHELTGVHVVELALERLQLSGALPPRDPEAIALLLHTSGTTSQPKLVPIRQRNLAASARNIAAAYCLTADDVSHCVMPLFHVHGLIGSTLAAISAGAGVIVPRRFSAGSFWKESRDYGATFFSAVPTIHQILLAQAQNRDIPAHSLRFARSSSSALPGAVMREFEERVGVPLVEAFSMTEASHQMTTNPLPPGTRRPSTVGLPAGTEIAIVGDDWQPVPPGQHGEVTVRGAGVVDGYRDNPEANAASFRASWFRTGDQGYLSKDGHLSLVGRIRELINRGGEKISPLEVENTLLSHASVAEATVFAMHDAKYGEAVAAVVVTSDHVTVDALVRHCAQRLAAFKIPATIVVADAIPKGPTGKVQRRLLPSQLGL
jgi:acyl-CoA synthetase (AMP-forming)/AMP-acid ligase II